MRADEQAYFRLLLQKRRHEAVQERSWNEAGVIALREGKTDPEYEEAAQVDHSEYLLHQLSDAQHREVGQVDAALARLDAGNYGECLECGNEIEVPRLFALPYSLRCAECAANAEEEQSRLGPSSHP